MNSLAEALENQAGPLLDRAGGHPLLQALRGPQVAAQQYRRALVSLHGYCRSLEPILLARPEWTPHELGLPPGGRVRLLEQDLQLLGAPRGPTAPLAYLPPLTRFPEHAGGAWALARAPLDGGNAAGLLNGGLPSECHKARSFVGWHCRHADSRHTAALIEGLLESESDRKRTVAAARATAHGLDRWLRDAEPVPALESPTPSRPARDAGPRL